MKPALSRRTAPKSFACDAHPESESAAGFPVWPKWHAADAEHDSWFLILLCLPSKFQQLGDGGPLSFSECWAHIPIIAHFADYVELFMRTYIAVEFQLRPWPQTSGNIGENYGDGTWSAGLNASRCICWKNPSVRRCSKLCAEPWLWLKPESCNFPNSEPGHRASGKRLPEKLVLSHSSIAVLRPRFSLCDEGILQEHKGRTSAQSEFFGCGTKALTARI